MYEVDQLLEIAREILRKRCPRLAESVVDVLAHHAIAKPIDSLLTETEVKRELGKRITILIQTQFPHHQPRRHGRGALIPIGDGSRSRKRTVRDYGDYGAEVDPESQNDVTDKILSKRVRYSLDPTHSESIQREKEKNADMVEEVLQLTSPTTSAALQKILPVVSGADKLRELGRQADLSPMAVSRAFKEVRDFSEGKRPRRPGLSAESNGHPVEGINFNPPTVSAEAIWRPHGGAVIADIGIRDRRTKPSYGHRPERPKEDISTVRRPRWPQFVEHRDFGKGAVLRDQGDFVWVEFDDHAEDGKRRRKMLREYLSFINGNSRP